MKCERRFISAKKRSKVRILAITSLSVILSKCLFGQDGNEGIEQATKMVNSYFDSGANLMYAIGALLGLIGGVKVYQKWNHGDHDTGKVAAAWFGSCIFLVVVATVIKSFFGL